jgi:iron complex transport system ATP-binding protein
LGFGIATGILHCNDVDYRVASSMKLKVVSEESFCPIQSERTDEALPLLQNAQFVIDTGFPVGDFNRTNIDLLRKAIAKGGICLSMREPGRIAALYGREAAVVTPVASAEELQGWIGKLEKKAGAGLKEQKDNESRKGSADYTD